jgi:bifunctional non-homologous end joining protein LigD
MAKLEEYKKKRRFDATPEPSGEAPKHKLKKPKLDLKPVRATGNSFVVQKHAARRLHYDLRLEIDGVLKSWAVPKGPSLDPGEKRLAVMTEDHPLDYGGFEGNIPEGNYGAGTVMIWDRGRYELVAEPPKVPKTIGGDAPKGKKQPKPPAAPKPLPAAEQVARGEIKLALDGHKLAGSFVLVRIKRGEKGNEWLLIKHKDAAARPGWNIEENDGSVLTGRSTEEIKEGMPPAHGAQARPGDMEGAREAPMPAKLEPMLATLMDKPFSNPEWLFEVKWDGVRALAWVRDGKLELRARSGSGITAQYPELASLPERFSASQALLDGEIVVLDEKGRSDFERLQERMHVRQPPPALQQKAPVTLYIFDLLYCDGYDLREVPLAARKEFLRRIFRPRDPFRYSDHQMEKGKELFELARQHGLEGILGKHARSSYASARSPYWVKFKVRSEVDAVVAGWTAPRESRQHFGSLALGLYEGEKLVFIGTVGSGFTEKMLKEIAQKLKPLATSRCPFATAPDTKEKCTWVKPQMVVRAEYSDYTNEKRLRHPVFLGVREDMDPQECRVETEAPAAKPPDIVRAPAIVGALLKKKSEIEDELLRGRRETVTAEIDGKPVRLSNMNKVYFPESGYTKRQLLAYYYRVAGRILPYLRGRPLVLRRYPDGITGESFFQKDTGEAAPEWMPTFPVYSDEKKREVPYYMAADVAALLYLTNLGCIDQNPWFSKADNIEHPDYFAFDLDPTEGTEFSTTVQVARAVIAKVESLGLKAFVKTSGATGIHVWVPVEPVYTYEQVRTFAEIVARMVTHEDRKRCTMDRAVEKRKAGSVYVDVFQNSKGRPLATTWAVRAFPKAPVSTPLEPAELRPNLRPEEFNIESVFARIEKRRDPWEKFFSTPQRLEKATEALAAQVPSDFARKKEAKEVEEPRKRKKRK